MARRFGDNYDKLIMPRYSLFALILVGLGAFAIGCAL